MSFARQVVEATNEAFHSSGNAHQRSLTIAGIGIQIQTTDAPLMQAFSSALAHHSDTAKAPNTIIRIWSASATGVSRPRMPAQMQERIKARRPAVEPREPIQIDFDPTAQMLSVMDASTNCVDVCITNIETLPDWEQATPLRNALGWVLRQHNRHLLHAAAVSENGDCALLLGAGGAGKSTAALRCRQAGMHLLGDDICGLQPGANPQIFNVYGTAKTHWHDQPRFPELHPRLISKPSSQKAIYTLTQDSRLTKAANARVLLLLDHSLPVLSVIPADPARVVALVAATTASFLPGSGPPLLSALATLARRLPVLRISPGEEPEQTAQLVRELIRNPPPAA